MKRDLPPRQTDRQTEEVNVIKAFSEYIEHHPKTNSEIRKEQNQSLSERLRRWVRR